MNLKSRTVTLPQEIIDKCRNFAEARTGDSLKLYTIRGEARRQKIFGDIFTGALAEYAVHSLLPGSTEPDLNIYEKKKKSYSEDIKYNGMTIHVKSQVQSSAKRYGLSWVFQRTDPLLTRPSKNDILALCCVLEGLDVVVQGFAPVTITGVSGSFRDLKVPQYRGSKLALYFEDVMQYMLSQEELNEFGERNTQKEG